LAKSYGVLIGCVFIWALNYISRQMLLKHFSPLALSAISLTLVALLFFIWAAATRSLAMAKRKNAVMLLLGSSAALIANQVFLFQGLKFTTATNASLIFTLAPLMTAGLSVAFLKERVTWRMAAGCLVAIAGLFMALNTNGFALYAGDWLLLGATFTFACNLIFTRYLCRHLSPFLITVYTFTISALLFAPYVVAADDIDWNQSLGIWGLLVVSVVIGQGLTGVMWNKAMDAVGAAKASIVLNLQPLMTLLLEVLLFGRAVSFQQMFGVFLVILGVLFATLPLPLLIKKKMPEKT